MAHIMKYLSFYHEEENPNILTSAEFFLSDQW